jgi:hypothetical protein
VKLRCALLYGWGHWTFPHLFISHLYFFWESSFQFILPFINWNAWLLGGQFIELIIYSTY